MRFVTPAPNEKSKAEGHSLLEIKRMNKSATSYNTLSGAPAEYSTWSGRNLSATEFSSYLDIVRASDGSLLQIWNLWDGLANIEKVSNDGYSIAFYLSSQVGEKDPDSGCYVVTGTLFKTFDIGTNEMRDRLVVTERPRGARLMCVLGGRNKKRGQ